MDLQSTQAAEGICPTPTPTRGFKQEEEEEEEEFLHQIVSQVVEYPLGLRINGSPQRALSVEMYMEQPRLHHRQLLEEQQQQEDMSILLVVEMHQAELPVQSLLNLLHLGMLLILPGPRQIRLSSGNGSNSNNSNITNSTSSSNINNISNNDHLVKVLTLWELVLLPLMEALLPPLGSLDPWEALVAEVEEEERLLSINRCSRSFLNRSLISIINRLNPPRLLRLDL